MCMRRAEERDMMTAVPVFAACQQTSSLSKRSQTRLMRSKFDPGIDRRAGDIFLDRPRRRAHVIAMPPILRHSICTISLPRPSTRRISSLVNISPRVKSAISSRAPVVALESAIITHGFDCLHRGANINRHAIPTEHRDCFVRGVDYSEYGCSTGNRWMFGGKTACWHDSARNRTPCSSYTCN